MPFLPQFKSSRSDFPSRQLYPISKRRELLCVRSVQLSNMGSNFITTWWNWSVSLYKILKGLHRLFKPKKGFWKQFRKLPSWKWFPHVSLKISISPFKCGCFLDYNKKWKGAYFCWKRRHNLKKKSPRILYMGMTCKTLTFFPWLSSWSEFSIFCEYSAPSRSRRITHV